MNEKRKKRVGHLLFSKPKVYSGGFGAAGGFFEKGDKSEIPAGTLNMGEVPGATRKQSNRDILGPGGKHSVKPRAEQCVMDPTHTPPLHLSNLL